MQMFLRSVLALAFLGVFLLAQPSNAENSDDFNEVDLFLGGGGNITTTMPTSDDDTQTDCPQDSNRKSWIGDDRQWGDVATWEVQLQTDGSITPGTYLFKIWANATQGDVDDVQFRISIDVNGDEVVNEAESNVDGVDSEDDQATEFEIEFEISNNSFRQDNGPYTLQIDLEYSGGEDGEEPIIGGDSTDQIVVLYSSMAHPSGIEDLNVNHYQTNFKQITVEETYDRVFVKTETLSAFGESDIDSSVWTLGVFGESSGNQGMLADFNTKSSKNGSYEVTFYWYYNRDNAISDTYHFYLEATDIQGNTWQITSDEDLYLVIHEFEVDNSITAGDIQINNQTGMATVKAGNSFTIDITVSAHGDPLITYNPIPVAIILVSGSTEIVLHDTVVFASPGATATTSFRHTFDENGEYLIKVVLDRGDLIQESDETNNVAEFVLVVSEPVKEDFIQSLIDDVMDGGAATRFVALAAVSIILGAIFLKRSRVKTDLEWEEDDEF
ncbi:MAG: CARDB domain-containing protein [Candidatus Poseidoniia archaeon]|nr:CARDB domain-containing protein [Candidatus Poseidoniia archaeon]